MGVVADREATLDAKILALSQRDVGATAQLDKSTAQIDKEQRATTIKSFFIILVASLFLVTFLGFVIARRRNNREQAGEEQQMLIEASEANPAGNDIVVVLQNNRFEIEGSGTNHDETHHRRHWIYTLQAKVLQT